MSSSTSRPDWDSPARGRTVALWVGVLAGPLLFLTLLQVNYVLSYVACETHRTWYFYAAALAASALTAVAGSRAWSARVMPERGDTSQAATGVVYAPRTREQWMAVLAALSSAWFIIAMLSLIVPAVVLQPCQ